MARYHDNRTAEWGNWGITFLDPQPDPTKNYGVIVGHIRFPVGTRGPVDSIPKQVAAYKQAIAAWIADRTIPEGFIYG